MIRPSTAGVRTGEIMKRWKAAGAGLAVLALLALVAGMGLGSGSADAPDKDDRQASVATGTDGGPARTGDGQPHAPDPSRRAAIALPAIKAGSPVPLQLTRGTLERAWQAGRLDVALPGGQHYAVALEEQRLDPGGQWTRSEEHTSELQSLMRISYAVFCLKKKKKSENL